VEWDRRSGRFPAALANDALARPKIHGRFRQTLVQQENCKLNLDLMEIVRSTHCNHHKHLKVPALIPIKQIWHCTIAVKNAGRRGVFDDKASVQFSTDQGGGESRSGNGTAFLSSSAIRRWVRRQLRHSAGVRLVRIKNRFLLNGNGYAPSG